jgi:hypothetical protein
MKKVANKHPDISHQYGTGKPIPKSRVSRMYKIKIGAFDHRKRRKKWYSMRIQR